MESIHGNQQSPSPGYAIAEARLVLIRPDGKFCFEDENGLQHGSFDTEGQAEQAAWTYAGENSLACNRAQKVAAFLFTNAPDGHDPYEMDASGLANVLADLRHFAHAYGIDFAEADRKAYDHYSAEAATTGGEREAAGWLQRLGETATCAS